MKHGGDIISYQHLYNGKIIDFSSNINPLGYPKILDEVIPQGLEALTAYPDIQYRALRQAIAEYLGCQPDEVLVGNGSMEILEYFCQSAERVLVCIPCFSEYLERPPIYHKEVVRIRLSDDFQVSRTLVESELKQGDVLILGNPNNPTGLRIPEHELRAIQQLTEERKAFLVLDEAFFEFCAGDYDSIRLFYDKENVCIIRAATKFFGLPGIRLGYAYAVRRIAQKYHETALPWRINVIADLAGRVIFQDTEYIKKSKETTKEQRQFMLAQLKTLEGIKVYPTNSNFILLKLTRLTEDELFHRLIRQGLLIRNASSFEGLDHSHIRIAIKDHMSNKKLIKALQECKL